MPRAQAACRDRNRPALIGVALRDTHHSPGIEAACSVQFHPLGYLARCVHKELVLFLEDPNALKKSHEADFDRLSGVWHLLGKEVATVPEEYEPLQAPNDGFT